ncbi:hypothetical protein BDP55DRAFT_76110 [Colletotrichum godetiae]|uniref:Uncharacterized protein n=1 Tax=Colletotrichum godetiae TaxID=1209918 RepID=A0AAJ0F005_9PEZI|nr:uncharacterized protein BDP55DRAFT_76110 [Colletotrichum godetiae]KAK1688048.1 hypothetical protein BDP55DRAFT_76110 [Colletotrichum godetiae]
MVLFAAHTYQVRTVQKAPLRLTKTLMATCNAQPLKKVFPTASISSDESDSGVGSALGGSNGRLRREIARGGASRVKDSRQEASSNTSTLPPAKPERGLSHGIS